MTVRDEAAQLIFIPFQGAPPNSRSREYRNLARLIHETRPDSDQRVERPGGP